MNGLSILINYVGNTAFISSALENCETQVNVNTIILYDKLWAFIHEYRKDASPEDIEKTNQTMNTFFNHLNNRDIPLPQRITIITRLYQLLCMINIAAILKGINWDTGLEVKDVEG
jgi:hypothetical protein